MTDLTPHLSQLVKTKQGTSLPSPKAQCPTTETADEFLKEAYRINSHINSLLKYLHSIRHAYLSNTSQRQHTTSPPPTSTLTEPERDEIDTSTALLLRDLAASINNLSSAETLRQETESSLLRKRYGHSAAGALLFTWASGDNTDKPAAQVHAEESAAGIRTVRSSVLWFLRRGLEGAASVQRGMVEKRIERVREKEKSVLYKAADSGYKVSGSMSTPEAVHLSEADSARIEAQLSAEQLQLFAEENDTMLRHYEDTLGKVQNAEKSLLEISSLQNTLVSHLATQEEYISQLVSDADATTSNVGQGNKELKRATERRSTAQAVFWGTVGLCTWLVVWDLVF